MRNSRGLPAREQPNRNAWLREQPHCKYNSETMERGRDAARAMQQPQTWSSAAPRVAPAQFRLIRMLTDLARSGGRKPSFDWLNKIQGRTRARRDRGAAPQFQFL
jgi:hypothetical protein